MVLDKARPKYKENTMWPGMRGRDAVRKSTPKVNILQVFTIDFSEIQFVVNHKSQSDGLNNSAKSGMNLRRITQTIYIPLKFREKFILKKMSIVYSGHARHVSIWFDCSCVVR